MTIKRQKVVAQRIQNDCVICAVANICGYTYEQVYSKLTPEMARDIDEGLGLAMEGVKTLLNSLHIKTVKYTGRAIDSNSEVCLGGNRALLILDQGLDIRHMVAWDGFNVLESNKKHLGKYELIHWGMTVGGGALSAICIKTNRSHRKASLRKSHEIR